jgi:streptogramin lyase
MAFAITQYPLRAGGDVASGITNGPGGNLWFTEYGTDKIGSINPTTRVVSEFPLSISGTGPYGIAASTDGNLYFAGYGNSSVGVFNPTTQTTTEYLTPTANIGPDMIAVGPGGNLWFTEYRAGKIGMFNPSTHKIVEYPLSGAFNNPEGIVLGPDNNLWFTEVGHASIGRINSTTGVVTEFALRRTPSLGITLGPDHQLWFGEMSFSGQTITGAIAEIDPTSGSVTAYATNAGAFVNGRYTTGADGNIDYTGSQVVNQQQQNEIGQFVVSTGTNTNGAVPNVNQGQSAIAASPDGKLWFTANSSVGAASSFTIAANQSAITGNVGLFDANPQLAPGRTVYVDLHADGKLDAGDPSAIADAFGDFTITGVPVGTYTVRALPFPGDSSTTQSVTTVGGQLTTGVSLTVRQTSSILPLSSSVTPYGVKTPDVATAEVNALYNLILGRSPDAAGLSGWSSVLRSGTSLTQVAAAFFGSTEYLSHVATSYYQEFLGRSGTSGEVNAWALAMQRGVSEEQATFSFLSSAEFNATHAANSDFIQALYTDVLGRQAMAAEISAGSSALSSGTTRATMISDILNSTEADTRAAEGLYEILLGRPGDQGGLSAGTTALQARTPLVNLAIILIGSPEFALRAQATVVPPTTLSIANRSDYVFGGNGILYITDGANIDRYDTNAQTFLTPFAVGGKLLGIDISPDGKTLAVADFMKVGIDLVDVATGSVTAVNFTPDFSEGGCYSVAWDSAGDVLSAGAFNGSGDVPLRLYNPTTKTTTTISSVRQDSMLTASSDRKTIGIAESNQTGGPIAVFSVSTGTIVAQTSVSFWFLYEVATNPTGTQFVVPTGNGAYVYNLSGSTLNQETIVGKGTLSAPIGVLYSPTSHYLFLAEYDLIGQAYGVQVYDTTTWKQIATLDNYNFPESGSGAFGDGWMKISADGRTLAVSLTGGTRIYNVSSYS